jgi:hypothetical protein
MLIAEDLLLLLYGDESGKPVLASTELDYALAGAVLLELALLGRIDVAGPGENVKSGRLIVRDPSPTGSAVLDERLAMLAGKQGRRPKDVIAKLAKNLRGRLLDQLAGRGILRRNPGKVLGLFPVTRWPANDARHEQEVRLALDSALRIGTRPDERTVALISLLHAVNAVPKVITDAPDKKAIKRRAKQIAESAWAAEAVRSAVQAVQAASMAAITAAAAGGAVATGS